MTWLVQSPSAAVLHRDRLTVGSTDRCSSACFRCEHEWVFCKCLLKLEVRGYMCMLLILFTAITCCTVWPLGLCMSYSLGASFSHTISVIMNADNNGELLWSAYVHAWEGNGEGSHMTAHIHKCLFEWLSLHVSWFYLPPYMYNITWSGSVRISGLKEVQSWSSFMENWRNVAICIRDFAGMLVFMHMSTNPHMWMMKAVVELNI